LTKWLLFCLLIEISVV